MNKREVHDENCRRDLFSAWVHDLQKLYEAKADPIAVTAWFVRQALDLVRIGGADRKLMLDIMCVGWNDMMRKSAHAKRQQDKAAN